jgi:hypothetical protein
MLSMIPSYGSPLAGPLSGLGSTADVQNLQRALANLAIATQRPAINPGYMTGVVDDATMTALIAGMGLLSESLPSSVYLPMQAALAAGGMTSIAKKAVETYAAQLTVAANTAAVKYRTAPPAMMPFSPTDFLSNFFAPGWYTRPPGMLFLAVVGIVVYKKFLSPDAKKAA